MSTIHIVTIINAPIEVCFDLSRSVDLHKYSLAHTREEAIAGVTTGLMGLQDQVTWRARHLGFTQILSSRITRYEFPLSFRDSMVEGIFERFDHDHIFESIEKDKHTRMIDIFDWDSPLGILGKFADLLLVQRHLKGILLTRSQVIKAVAESEKWKDVLGR